MEAGVWNFTIHQGADESFKFLVLDDDNVVFPLTDYTIRLEAKENISDATPVITTVGVGANATIDMTEEDLGIFYFVMTDTQTAALDFKTAQYQIEFVDASGIVTRMVQGRITLSKEIVV